MAIATRSEQRRISVYGNIVVETGGASIGETIPFSGDGGDLIVLATETLYRYNNTVVPTRVGNTTWMRLPTSEESCDARHSVEYALARGPSLAIADSHRSVVPTRGIRG